MKLNDAAITVAGSAKIESRVHALLLIFKKAKGSNTTAMTLYDLLTAPTLKIDKIVARGTEQTIYPNSIAALIEASAHEGGSIKGYIDDTNMVIEAVVVLSPDGAEHLVNDEYFKLTLAGLSTGVSCDVFAIDAYVNARRALEYTPRQITANTPTNLQIANAKYLAIPVDEFTEITLTYPNAPQVTYSKEEIELICNQSLPILANIDNFIYPGFLNYYVLPVGAAVSAKLDMNADASVVIVTEKAI